MADIVNLRRARKARERATAAGKADANRAKHGMTKGEREAVRLEDSRRQRAVDGAKRERPDEADEAEKS